MNKYSLKLILVILSLTFVSSCSTVKKDQIKDIIPVLNLTAGKEKTFVLSDLFFSDNYDLKFSENENVNINYIQKGDSVSFIPQNNFSGLSLIEFELDNEFYYIPVSSKKESYHSFSFKPSKKYEMLTLFGSFNGWNRQDISMRDDDGDGTFEAEVALEPGVYQYKFFADGQEIVDPQNPNKVPNGFGDFNNIRVIEDSSKTKLFLHTDKHESHDDSGIFSFIAEYSLRSALLSGEVFALLNNSKVKEEYIDVKGSRIIITIPEDDFDRQDLLRVCVSKDGITSNVQYVFMFDGKPAANDNFTWYDAVIYSLMIDRFSDGDASINNPVSHDSLSGKANYFGGDIKGIINKLNEDYFNKLGINTIWISPLMDNPNEAYKEYPAPHRYYAGYHGYWPIHHQRVEEKFGSMQQVKELVETAHKKGIKVLLDFVSNHVHEQHPFYREHKDWFGKLELPDGRLNLRFWDEYRLTTWFEPYMPSFDYLGSDEAIEAMTDNAVWWLEQTKADGYRHDAVKHVPNKFWRRLTQKLKEKIATKRQIPVYQIGETFGSYDLISSYVNNGQLHSQFNFNLYDAAIPIFINNGNSFDALNKEMFKTFSVYGNLHLMGNIMDSHDKNRFMSYADKDLDVTQWSAIEEGWNNPPAVNDPQNYKKLILYYAYMNTIPGLPVIYYGSEFGMTGASDPDNRRMMRFDDELSEFEKATLEENKKIINIRKQYSALRYGDFYTLQADENVYAYIRSDLNERILVVLNKSLEQQELNIKIPIFYDLGKLVSLKDGNFISVNNNEAAFSIDGQDWQVYKLE